MDISEPKLILASGSARRKEILENHGLKPLIMPMDVDESLPEGISPYDAVMYLSLKKGLACEEAVLERGDNDVASRGKLLIVSSDTVVYSYDETLGKPVIMGKPKDEEDAWRMLSSIRDRAHEVVTGVTLIGRDTAGDGSLLFKRSFHDVTKVYVGEVTDAELKEYIDSGEPFGKAGGYAIQLAFGKYIDHIEGDYENVVGLPYEHLVSELAAL